MVHFTCVDKLMDHYIPHKPTRDEKETDVEADAPALRATRPPLALVSDHDRVEGEIVF